MYVLGSSSPASLKDEELRFPREVRASSIVELLQNPLIRALFPVTPEYVAISTVAQNYDHNHLGLKQTKTQF